MASKIRLAQIGYTSEWALAKFFSALREQQVQERFELLYLCGREKDEKKAFGRLEDEIMKSIDNLQDGWRKEQRIEEIKSRQKQMRDFYSGKVKYLPVNENLTLSQEVYEHIDGVAIFSSNGTHWGYLRDALNHGKQVLCEKPLVSLLDNAGQPDDCQLRKLETILRDADPKLTVMDSEHYSYKRASLLFYEHQQEILRGRKIKSVEGCLKEIDDPQHERTRAVLSPANGTGLLLDTGIHLQAFMTYLGGEVEVVKSEYGVYPGYSVDTYDAVDFKINGGAFSKDAVGNFVLAKFIDQLEPPEEKESKYLKLFLEDDTEIEINFKDNKVVERNPPQEAIDRSFFRYPLHQKEYVNVLGHFYESIKLQQPPRTNANDSLKTLQALFQMYTQHRKEIQPYSAPPAASLEKSRAAAGGK